MIHIGTSLVGTILPMVRQSINGEHEIENGLLSRDMGDMS